MDSQPERRKDYGKRIEVWWEGDDVYYRGTIMEYSKNSDKHTVYYDDGEKEKVSLATTPHRCAACMRPSFPLTLSVGKVPEPRSSLCMLQYSYSFASCCGWPQNEGA